MEPVTARRYAQAYRAVGRPDARLRQIQLTIDIGRRLSRIVTSHLIGFLLRAARAPAHAAGFGTLQGFLERGFDAFARIGDADRFLEAIQQREIQFMKELVGEQALPV